MGMRGDAVSYLRYGLTSQSQPQSQTQSPASHRPMSQVGCAAFCLVWGKTSVIELRLYRRPGIIQPYVILLFVTWLSYGCIILGQRCVLLLKLSA
jgi:hypothetical protein